MWKEKIKIKVKTKQNNNNNNNNKMEVKGEVLGIKRNKWNQMERLGSVLFFLVHFELIC